MSGFGYILPVCLIMLYSPVISAIGADDADLPFWKTDAELGKPVFVMKSYRRLESRGDSIRLDVGIEVMHDLVMFVRKDSVFSASAEVVLSIFDKSGEQIGRSVKTLTKHVASYDQTNVRDDFLQGFFTFHLPAGRYEMVAVLTDDESRRSKTVRRKVNLVSYLEKDVSISDIIIANTTELDNKTYLPRDISVRGRVRPAQKKVHCFVDLYRPDTRESCKLTVRVVDKRKNAVFLDSLSIESGNNSSSYFIPVTIKDFTFGKYVLQVQVTANGQRREVSTVLSVNSFGLPETIENVDRAIEQLTLVADKSEISAIRNASPAEREKKLIAFWNENFPAQGEVVNGKMLEYYARIEYAERHFGSTGTGWETDRGRVFVIYGKPEEVERSSFDEQGTPYEIWYYNRLGKRFVFRDEYGFGEYRLVTPIW